MDTTLLQGVAKVGHVITVMNMVCTFQYIPFCIEIQWLKGMPWYSKEGKGGGTIDFLVPAKGCIKIRTKIQEHMERFNLGRFDLLRLGHPSGMAQKQILNPSNL